MNIFAQSSTVLIHIWKRGWWLMSSLYIQLVHCVGRTWPHSWVPCKRYRLPSKKYSILSFIAYEYAICTVWKYVLLSDEHFVHKRHQLLADELFVHEHPQLEADELFVHIISCWLMNSSYMSIISWKLTKSSNISHQKESFTVLGVHTVHISDLTSNLTFKPCGSRAEAASRPDSAPYPESEPGFLV